MRGMILGLIMALLFCLGCSFSPAEKQCRKRFALSGTQLKAKAISTCINKVLALKHISPMEAECLAECVQKATSTAMLTTCHQRCPVILSRR
ncbi:MAG: hypothetical protein JRH20_24590 [Deltaproteobacteria bacterium]|nr:hypothetical protein [Deltaproteobacteria bacterium]